MGLEDGRMHIRAFLVYPPAATPFSGFKPAHSERKGRFADLEDAGRRFVGVDGEGVGVELLRLEGTVVGFVDGGR
jgi:hypothetical protein